MHKLKEEMRPILTGTVDFVPDKPNVESFLQTKASVCKTLCPQHTFASKIGP